MKQYPAAFRERWLRALDAGLARAEATRPCGVPERSIRRWQQRQREEGERGPHAAAGPIPAHRHRGRSGPARARADPPDATLAAPGARWAAPQGLSVSPAPLSRAVRRLGLPLNKRR